MNLRDRLQGELSRRQRRNPRYSLRAFARAIGVGHCVLSRILAGDRRITPRIIRAIALGLGASERETAEFLRAECERLIVASVRDSRFRADCRWLACKTGMPIDDVNRTLFTLMAAGRLRLVSPERWTLAPSAGSRDGLVGSPTL